MTIRDSYYSTATPVFVTIGDYNPNIASYRISVSTIGEGSGTIAESTTGISCTANAGTCSVTAEDGTSVRLVATAASGSKFVGWGGDCAWNLTSTVSTTLSGNLACSARFDALPVEPQTGFWYSTVLPGVGFGIEKRNGTLLLSGYLYRSDGTPVWYLASGTYDSSKASADLYEYSGGPMLTGDSRLPTANKVAGMTITFSDAATGTLTWDGLASPLAIKRFSFGDERSADALIRPGTDEQAPPRQDSPALTLDRLRAAAHQDGKVRVIALLNPPAADSDGKTPPMAAAVAAQARAITNLLASLGGNVTFSADIAPIAVIEATPAALEGLLISPEVTTIHEDKPHRHFLRESAPQMKADKVWAAGITGAGTSVAILDTGVDNAHPFLSGRVVAEACFSTTTTYQGVSITSACPNGASTQSGTGSARPCSAPDCSHGTHVAGIAAGSASDIHGIAPGASIIAAQVFSIIHSQSVCNPDPTCTLTFTSDYLKAMNWVAGLPTTYKIAAVNMSFGGDYTSSYCDSEPEKPVIDALKALGIASVIASGNDGYNYNISYPACVSTAVPVGAVTKSDAISYYTNLWSKFLLLAPGSSITSSIPGGSYAAYSGTSMATPHITGSFALLRQESPNATVDSLINTLKSFGTQITHPYGASYGTYRRPDLYAAAQNLGVTTSFESGWWWTEGVAGRGYFIELQGSTVFLAVYHYLDDGRAVWQVGQGTAGLTGTIEADLQSFSGGGSLSNLSGQPVPQGSTGHISLTFQSATTGSIVLPNGQRQSIARYRF